MAGFPKIALARLKANPGAPTSSGPPRGPDDFQGGQHPDANLLAAFVEKTLTERERTQVLNHLVQCAECREVAAFTLPAEAAAAEPIRPVAWRRWSPWPLLRWGAMAAVLGTLTVVVVLHPGMWKGHPEISKETPPPVPAGNIATAPPTVSPTPSAQGPPETAKANAQKEARESAGEQAAVEKAWEPHRDLARSQYVARAKANKQATFTASSGPRATFRAENVPGVNAEREESKGGSALTSGALPAPSLPSAPADLTMAAPEEAAKAGAESQAGVGTLRATTQSVAVPGGNTSAGTAEAAPEKAAPRVGAMETLGMTAHASVRAMRASRKDTELGAGLPVALWSVSSDGKVQRSTDGGKTFEPIPIAHGIKFLAIAALGNDVWTGGTGGALFHSVDGGATWNRAGINIDGNAVTETIAGIRMHDLQHLTVITASGSQWVSEDGGQHWQKQP